MNQFLTEVVVYFITEISDIHIHNIGIGVEILVPYSFEQTTARQYLTVMFHHIVEQAAHLDTEVHFTMTADSLMRSRIKMQIGIRDRTVGCSRIGTAKHSLYTGKEFHKLERFDHIVVGTHMESHHDIISRVEGCEHQYRSVVSETFPYLLTDFQTSHSGHTDIEHHKVELLTGFQSVPCIETIVDHSDIIIEVRQSTTYDIGDILLNGGQTFCHHRLTASRRSHHNNVMPTC